MKCAKINAAIFGSICLALGLSTAILGALKLSPRHDVNETVRYKLFSRRQVPIKIYEY